VVTIESDKSSVEVPSTLSGIIETIKVKVGDKVSKGDLIRWSIVDIENSIDSFGTKKLKIKAVLAN